MRVGGLKVAPHDYEYSVYAADQDTGGGLFPTRRGILSDMMAVMFFLSARCTCLTNHGRFVRG